MRRFVFGVAALLVAGGLHAQSFTTGPCNGDEGKSNDDGWFSGHTTKLCEIRRITLPINGQANVSGFNGGIEVTGEDRRDIALEAKVIVQDSSRNAESVMRQIEVKTRGTIEAEGPKISLSFWNHSDWSVSYKLRVPRHMSGDLKTMNGDVKLTSVDGSIHVATTNGDLTLTDVAGDIHAETVNGGVHVAVTGPQWQGPGLWAKTVNGGIHVKAPDHYSAHLVVDTVNGDISVGFPVTVQGGKIGNHLDGNLGGGGPTIGLRTVNGGVSVNRDQQVQ